MAQTTIDLSNQQAARQELARSAAIEISQIVDCLDRAQGADDMIQPALWRGMYLRLDTLASVVISALGDDIEPIEDLATELYGAAGWQPKVE